MLLILYLKALKQRAYLEIPFFYIPINHPFIRHTCKNSSTTSKYDPSSSGCPENPRPCVTPCRNHLPHFTKLGSFPGFRLEIIYKYSNSNIKTTSRLLFLIWMHWHHRLPFFHLTIALPLNSHEAHWLSVASKLYLSFYIQCSAFVTTEVIASSWPIFTCDLYPQCILSIL